MPSSGPTLLILAAGMGSRFGGLKQVEPIGPNGESILEYSLFDAVQAGFEKAVFVIRPEFEAAFRERFLSALADRLETFVVFQEMDSCVAVQSASEGRTKPWGTAHAVLVARDTIQEPFAVINADDYYGPGAYRAISTHLLSSGLESPTAPSPQDRSSKESSEYAMVGYTLNNTLSDFGTVCRGKCDLSPENYLTQVTELRTISRKEGRVVYRDQEQGALGAEKTLTGNEIVSLNFWGFGPDLFAHLQRLFDDFIESSPTDRQEFEIPTSIDHLIQSGTVRVKVLPTDERWFGLTYQEDRDLARTQIANLVQQGVYPKSLWV